MSDGLNNLAGPRVVSRTFGDQEYHFRIYMPLDDHAEKEAHILSLKPHPLSVLSQIPAGASPQTVQRITDAALKAATVPQFVPREQEQAFDGSLHGVGWGVWRMLRDDNDGFGKLGDSESARYTAPGGTGYSVTPAEGVQLALRVVQSLGNEHLSELMALRDGAEQKDLVGNSSGSGTSRTPEMDM